MRKGSGKEGDKLEIEIETVRDGGRRKQGKSECARGYRVEVFSFLHRSGELHLVVVHQVLVRHDYQRLPLRNR